MKTISSIKNIVKNGMHLIIQQFKRDPMNIKIEKHVFNLPTTIITTILPRLLLKHQHRLAIQVEFH